MKPGTILRTGAGMFFALLAIAAQPSAWGQTFTTFDPPGSQLTAPGSINAAGQITGSYFDSTFAQHGFVRGNDGTISSFDVPGFLATIVITQQGVVVGLYFDQNGSHIFERATNGTITTLEFPSPGASIYALVANSAGAIAGAFFDSNGNPKIFLRAPSGQFTLTEFPPAFLTFFFVPNITALTPGGTIMGSYFDSNGAIHGFLRTVDGTFTTFDAPNAAAGFFTGTTPTSINNSGTIAGFFNDASQNGDLRVFLRFPDGAFSIFDTPQLETVPGAAVINPSGAVAGNVQNTVCGADSCTTTLVSFLLAANGTIKQVNDPLAVPGTQSNQGTGVLGINPAGEMFGIYSDTNGVQHGFVTKP